MGGSPAGGNTVPMVIQMNGKLRDKLEVPKDISREELENRP